MYTFIKKKKKKSVFQIEQLIILNDYIYNHNRYKTLPAFTNADYTQITHTV